jgi:hypothetical protein
MHGNHEDWKPEDTARYCGNSEVLRILTDGKEGTPTSLTPRNK